MFWLGLIIGLVVGAVVCGLIVINNQKKAKSLRDAAAAEIKAKLEKAGVKVPF